MSKDSLKDRLNGEIRFLQGIATGEIGGLGEIGFPVESRRAKRAAENDERMKELSTTLGRARAAVIATTLSAEFDQSLRKAFDAFGLNPDDPRNWTAMLRSFARVHFGPKKKGGRPREWNSARYWQLVRDVADKQSNNPNLSKEDAYRLLAKDQNYKGIGARGIKAAYRNACDPRKNDELMELANMLFSKFGDEATQAAMEASGLSREDAQALAMRNMIEAAIEYVIVDKAY